MLFDLRTNSLDAVFFDFDGVLVDSTEIKTSAYKKIFEPMGQEAVRLITDYHLENGGLDRFKKIRFVLEKLNLELSEINLLAQKFSEIVKDKVILAASVNGMLELVISLNQENIPLYIVSGTPEVELQEIVLAKKWNSFFKEVKGSPRTKPEIVESLLQKNHYNPLRCIFFGDAITDYKTAIGHNLWYIGIPRL